MDRLVEVVQADREAASEFVFGRTYQLDVLQGRADDSRIVQAFANHRIAAITESGK